MKRTARAFLVTALGAAASLGGAAPAFAAAWPVKHQWSDIARPGDPTSGSFAYEYEAASVALAGQITASGAKWDCSKFAMTVLVDYAEANGLEVTFTCRDPANGGKVGTVSSSDARFKSPKDFVNFYKTWINAQEVAQYNTSKISYDTWKPGDLVLMRWNQLGANDPFQTASGKPEDVWHTYFVADPGKLVFYGNDDGGAPLPVTASSEDFRMAEVHAQGDTGPAVYEQAPRRWNIIKDAIVPPKTPLKSTVSPEDPQQATVDAKTATVSGVPSSDGSVLETVDQGTKLSVEGETSDGWTRVRLADGRVGYVSSSEVSVAAVAPSFTIVGGDGPDNRFATDASPPSTPAPTTGINGALGAGTGH
jgi:hypothetical protein